ncbi:hypothetical protein HID58_087626, partial [Brassica napus]
SIPGMRGVSFISSALVAKGLYCAQGCGGYLSELRIKSDLYGILSDILLMSNEFESFDFVWISRVRNVEAYMLAKNDLSLY